jgi:tetratricopeptide (TPR) repeat protein
MAEPERAKAGEPAPSPLEGDKPKGPEAVDSSKRYWWIAAIAMPLLLFALARLWPESKPPGPATNSITNFVTVQNEILSFTGAPLTDPDLKTVIEQALARTANGDHRGSIPLYQAALKQAPVPALYNNLAVAYAKIDDTADAKTAFQSALAKDPKYEVAIKNLAALNAPKASNAYFSDDFIGTALTRDWTMMNPDPKKWTIEPGKKSLLIVTQTGTSSKDTKNWLTLNKELPSGDFEVIVEASFQIQGVGNYISVVLWADDQNYIGVGFSGDPWGSNIARTLHFSELFEGKRSSFDGERRFGQAQAPEHIFMKIDRKVNEYSGYYAYGESVNQISWSKMGTLPWINFRGKLGIVAANMSDDAPAVAAEVQSVVIRKL